MIESFKDKNTEELIIEGTKMRTKNLIHPGEILLEEFMIPMGVSQNKLALDIHVPAPRINAIVHGKRSITADTALRLGAYFGVEPQFWMNLQSNYDIGVASSDSLWKHLKEFINPLGKAAVL